MIDKVVICGARRANSLVPMQEIQQAIGRAGRSYTKSGEAVIICEPEDAEYAAKCLKEQVPPVKSRLSTIDQIAFHVLPWIERVNDEETFDAWFQKSLAYQQGVKIDWVNVRQHLVKMKCINENNELLDFGKISTRFYFSPERINSLAERLQEAYFNGNLMEPLAMSWVLAANQVHMDNVDAIELSNYKQAANTAGYRFYHGELIEGYAYYCIMVGQRPKWVKPIVSQLMEDVGRLLGALAFIASSMQFPIVDDIQALATSVLKRVPFQMAKLMEELGIEKKQYAYELFDMDICCRDDIQCKMQYIEKYATDGLKKELVRIGILNDDAILHGIGHFARK